MQAKFAFVGVDVAKDTLVVSIHGTATSLKVANEKQRLEQWLETLPPEAMIAMESTGCYHQQLARLAHRSGRRVYVLNAGDVYYYAKALGARGKTDRVDAQVIARYVAEHHGQLHAWCPGEESQAALQTLLQRRAHLVAHRVAVRELTRGVNGLEDQASALQVQFEQLLQRIDDEVDRLIAADAELARRCQLLRTITGIGPQASAMLAALLTRIRFANADALVAYSGLDPRANDSGAKSGRRRLSKRGNADLRRLMYLAGFGASHSKVFGALYRSIKARGFAPTEAMVILGRKLLRIAWAVWKTGQPFDPTRILGSSACAKT